MANRVETGTAAGPQAEPAAPGCPDCVVVLNPHAGDADADDPAGERRDRIAAAFEEHGWTARIVALDGDTDIADAVGAARESGCRLVVAAGGDGTVSGVLQAMPGADLELGVIPLGTFNYFARRFGIPQDIAGAVEVICAGHGTPVDVGTINDTPLINNASLGAYASILERREAIYRRWGRSRLAAYWSVAVALLDVYRPLVMEVTVDGTAQRHRSPMVFAALSAYQLDEFGLDGAEAIRNGEFAILLAPDCSRAGLIWKALLVALRGLKEGRDFTLMSGRHVVIETKSGAKLVAHDGERDRMEAPFEFRLLRDGVRLRAPKAEPDRESPA